MLTVEVPLHKWKKITNTFSDSNYIYSNTKSFRQVSKHTTIICKPGGPRRSTLPSWPIGYFFPFYPEIPRINPNTTIVWSKFLSRYTLMYISLISPVSPVRRRCPIIPGQSLLPLGISCRQQLYRWHSFIPTCTRRDRSKPYSADAGRFSDHPKSEKPASPTKAGELPIAFSIRHFTNITISFSITQTYDI